MAEVIIHLGMHKTGTTWLQRQLFPELDRVEVKRAKSIEEIAGIIKGSAPGGDCSRTIILSEVLSGSTSPRRKPGSSNAMLKQNLERIAVLAPNKRIIIGFREQRSWLQSAFSHQKAKKSFDMSLSDYADLYVGDDLLWCHKLDLIEEHCPSVFPFLFEELLQRPHALIDDLCRFIGKPTPPNLDELLRRRENVVPRSEVGQRISKIIKFFPSRSKRAKLERRRFAYRVGALFDRYFLTPPLSVDTEFAGALGQDWNNLLRRIGERRRRDFSVLSRYAMPGHHGTVCGSGRRAEV
jgi:Sulfotransferase domain